jgi:hypothetical protein
VRVNLRKGQRIEREKVEEVFWKEQGEERGQGAKEID